MKYDKYKYIFPPRPKNKIHPEFIIEYSDGKYIGQPKLNGSNCVIFTNGIKEDTYIMNRHGEKMSRFEIEDIHNIHVGEKGLWMVINGEYMNKSKKDHNRKNFNHKFVIFDILVYNNEYLLGSTFEQRVKILDQLYGKEDFTDFLWRISNDVYRVKSFDVDLEDVYSKLTKIDMFEGLVIKRKNGKLKNGRTSMNNHMTQLKVRKPTKNYTF